MKKTIKLFGVVLAAAAMFAACVQDPEVKPSEKATTLSIEPATIEAEIAPNGPFDVQVKANGTWVVVNSLDWVTVEPNKGDGNATVQVTVDANEQDGVASAPRTGAISALIVSGSTVSSVAFWEGFTAGASWQAPKRTAPARRAPKSLIVFFIL